MGNPAKEADEEVKHSKQSSKKKTKQLSIQMNDNFGVEAFQLSNQSFEAVQRGLLDLPPVESVSALHNKLSEGSSKGLTIQLKGKALIASEEVEAIDALMLAIPLPIVFQSQDTKKSTKNIKGEGAVFPSFAHDFSTPQERSTSTMQQEQVRQDFLKKLLKHVTTSKASSSKVTKQGKSLFVESVDRMRDLHLLHYLQVYLSPQTATSLAGYLVQSQAGLENLPINVQVELNMLLQSLDLSSDDDQ